MIVERANHERIANEPHTATVYSWDYLFLQLSKGLTGPPIELHLVRHAETVANAQGLIAGQADVGLSWRGYVQAFVLGFRLRYRYDIACVSGLVRTQKTLQIAEAIRFGRISRRPVCSDPRLNERSLGDLEGTSRHVIDRYAVGDLTYAPRHGESYLDLAQRLLSFLLDLRRHIQCEAHAIVATHVGPMRLLVGMVEGMDDPQTVLSLRFSNAETHRCILRQLTWPVFIRKEVLFEKCHPKVEGALAAADN